MQLFKNIIGFEWKQFLRQPTHLFILLFFLLMGLFSLYNGQVFVRSQLSGLDSLQLSRQARIQEVIEKFHADTTTEKGKTLAAQAGIPQVIEFRAPPIATNPAHPLALMAIGQRDLLPYFDIINVKRDILTPPNAEIANPEKLASGNFDFSFVLIYLFPLLIIVLSYNIFSQEREQQTDRLLSVQGGNMNLILGYKLFFRFILVSITAWIVMVIGFIIQPVPVSLKFQDWMLWWLAMSSYLIFWFSVCWLIIKRRKSSRINALNLIGIWLLLILLLPAIANKIADIAKPMPLRTELTSNQREIMQHTWEIPIRPLLDTFYRNNPQYIKLRRTDDTAQYGNKRFAAYYDLLGRRMNHDIRKYNHTSEEHNLLSRRMALFNPVAGIQQVLNGAAQTGLSDYLSYQKQVTDFQNRWVTFMNSYLLANKKMSIQEVKTMPEFRFQEDPSRIQKLLLSLLSIWMAVILILIVSKKIQNH